MKIAADVWRPPQNKNKIESQQTRPEVIKLFSTQMSMKCFMLIDLKILTIANSFWLNIDEHEVFSANKYKNAKYCLHFHVY